MTKLKKNLALMFLSILLCSLFSLAGCKDTGKEGAVAEAAAAKTELTKIKANLASIMSEGENLKLKLAAVTEARDKLQAVVGQANNIKEQLAGLTEERDKAITKGTEAQGMVEKLKSQMAEQIQKVTGLEGQNKKLQGIIDELKKKLSGEVAVPSIPGL